MWCHVHVRTKVCGMRYHVSVKDHVRPGMLLESGDRSNNEYEMHHVLTRELRSYKGRMSNRNN